MAQPTPPTAPTPGQAAHDKELAELRKLLVPMNFVDTVKAGAILEAHQPKRTTK